MLARWDGDSHAHDLISNELFHEWSAVVMQELSASYARPAWREAAETCVVITT